MYVYGEYVQGGSVASCNIFISCKCVCEMLSTLLYDIVRKLYRSILRRTGEAVRTRTMLHAVYWSIFSCLTPWFTTAAGTNAGTDNIIPAEKRKTDY